MRIVASSDQAQPDGSTLDLVNVEAFASVQRVNERDVQEAAFLIALSVHFVERWLVAIGR